MSLTHQRLRFAHARGAQIKKYAVGRWEKISYPSWFDDGKYRVAPRHEHLQYGPLSTALRTWALYSEESDSHALDAALEFVNSMKNEFHLDHDHTQTEVEDDFELLFLAEYLADQGL